MDRQALHRFVHEDAALRRRQVLQPVGGQGDKIFPPTYPPERQGSPPRHVYERRLIAGEQKWCVLVDSVQAQSNRLEEALLNAAADGLSIPHLVVDFAGSGIEGIAQVTSMDAPHRVYDAILRDSLLDGTPFMESELGQRLAKAKPSDASVLLEVSPTSLVFGAWHSTGQGGGLGAKFARCLISEITAVDVPVEGHAVGPGDQVEVRTAARRTGSRIDPLGILRSIEVYKGPEGWDTTSQGVGQKAKRVRPSEINHGNIAPSVEPLGVTCDYLEHSFVLSFAALRRLQFGGGERDEVGRAYLAALGLLAMAEQDARGYALRSRCDLVCDGTAPLELVHPDGSTDEMKLDRNAARSLYLEALSAARNAGFDLADAPIRLEPQPKLVEIVRQSQERALAGLGGDEEGAGEA